MSVILLALPAPSPNDGLLVHNLVHILVLHVAALLFDVKLAGGLDRLWF